ncbi:MAG: tRNA lysidine(34) synthetase TilS [Anaerolineales bacterium]|nr:tRNA lysidine(34) synthetase TilS [Anaerolineales bacterium]
MGYNLLTMLSDLRRVLQDECQIDRDRSVLVAVSGGADSLCISEFMQEAGYLVVVAHFDHNLRTDSAVDAEFVRSYAQQRGVRFIFGQGDVKARVKQAQETVEEAARNARYQFLFATAEEIGAQAVVVGHSADDQVETLLMHLLRGSGLSGLGGMSYRWQPNAWHAEIPLVRPLLGTWRQEILAFCQERGLSPVEDQTNQDPAYFRNRLRLELVPYLETFNPAARKLIWQTAQVLRGDRQLISELVDAAWSQCFQEAGDDYVVINSDRTLEYSLGMQRHIMRKAISLLRPGLRDVSFEAVESGIAQIQALKPFAEIDLISGLKLVSEPGRLWVAEWETDLPAGEWPQVVHGHSPLELDSEIYLNSGWKILATKTTKEEITFPSPDEQTGENQGWLDLAGIQLPLSVRARREGDRFSPFGMEGHSQKLSDFMINEKIPRRARKGWPLVCSGDEILWVAGFRSAHSHEVTRKTEAAVQLTLSHSDG